MNGYTLGIAPVIASGMHDADNAVPLPGKPFRRAMLAVVDNRVGARRPRAARRRTPRRHEAEAGEDRERRAAHQSSSLGRAEFRSPRCRTSESEAKTLPRSRTDRRRDRPIVPRSRLAPRSPSPRSSRGRRQATDDTPTSWTPCAPRRGRLVGPAKQRLHEGAGSRRGRRRRRRRRRRRDSPWSRKALRIAIVRRGSVVSDSVADSSVAVGIISEHDGDSQLLGGARPQTRPILAPDAP